MHSKHKMLSTQNTLLQIRVVLCKACGNHEAKSIVDTQKINRELSIPLKKVIKPQRNSTREEERNRQELQNNQTFSLLGVFLRKMNFHCPAVSKSS